MGQLSRAWCIFWAALAASVVAGEAYAESVEATPLSALTTATDAEVGAPRQAYAILVGYPFAPDLPKLSLVASDVSMMVEFFRGVGPEAVHVHLPDGAIKRGLADVPSVTTYAPTYDALARSVNAIAARIDEVGRPADVYVYYAGHGKRLRMSDRVRTTLFLEPGVGVGPGADGRLSSDLLQRELLTPLSRRSSTRVHLIVDACHSYFLLEARGMRQVERVRKVHPGADRDIARVFERRYPQVGAMLATNGSQVTYEDSTLGGLFSYAVRSAAIGLADLDGDARVTYHELKMVLPQVLGARTGAEPGLLAPGGRDDVAFVDYRGRAVAAVEFAPHKATRYALHDPSRVAYAVLYPDAARPVRAFFPSERSYLAAEQLRPMVPPQWFRFVAEDGLFDRLREPAGPALGRGVRFPGLMPTPLPPLEQLVPVEPPRWGWDPQTYVSLAVMAEALAFPVGTGAAYSQRDSAEGFHLVAGHGVGRHQFSYRLGWSQWALSQPGRHVSDVVAPHGSLSYGWLLGAWPALELTAGGYVGGGVIIKFDDGLIDRDRALSYSAGGVFTARIFVPGSAVALRLDTRVGGQLLTDIENRLDLVTSVGAGLEYEFGLE